MEILIKSFKILNNYYLLIYHGNFLIIFKDFIKINLHIGN